MGTITADIPSKAIVLEECPIVITVNYTGDDTNKVTESTNIIHNIPQKTLFDSQVNILRDIEKNTCTAKFFVTAELGAGDIDLTFSVDVEKEKAELNIKLITINKNGYSRLAFEPIIIGDSLIKDLSPVADDVKPSLIDNPSLTVHIYAESKKNDPLPYFQIPLVTSKLVRIFVYNEDKLTEEILPFTHLKGSYRYYINTNSRGFVALKVFPRKIVQNNGYEVAMFTELTGFTRNASSSILFITEDLEPTLSAPNILELDGDKLTPPPGNTSTAFSVIVPSYKNAKPKDKIFLMIREGDNEKQSGAAVISEINQLNQPVALVPYASVPNVGDNELYYYVSDTIGNVVMSSSRYFNLMGSVPNEPPQIDRTLAVARIFTHQAHLELELQGKINYLIIQGGGLDAYISVGSEMAIDVDDIINVSIYINGTMAEKLYSVMDTIDPYTVTKEDVEAGVSIIQLGQGIFSYVDSYADGTPGTVYITYQVGNKNSKVWFGLIDTVPPGQ
ncbi:MULTISPECIES: hypothetical protein [Photorhabdus]|uniref:Uncharacterized protein n=2 Tax=Photorhabdus asymbiotica TaxID=291112 RepID=C7BN30_PHOAA|nr:hypothetical protein [Photorhabdus asymbiotica]RKS57015.1 hypothetical protein BDD30_3653 [Photorhabdus asymbiotica]CAQ84629.1 conserved hypothetical protein [Photorhabdus asymbiotica]